MSLKNMRGQQSLTALLKALCGQRMPRFEDRLGKQFVDPREAPISPA
jgi:hypothetical protein